MATIAKSLLFYLIISFQLINNTLCKRLLAESNLTALTYNELHKLAIFDQVNNHVPVQRSLSTRRTVSLDGMYTFVFDEHERGFEDQWFEADLKSMKGIQAKDIYLMPVPSAFNEITSNTEHRNYIGWFWYQTKITPQQLKCGRDCSTEQWFVQFESVNYLAIVWVQPLIIPSDERQECQPYINGAKPAEFVGSHVGGHLPFMVNLTRASLEQTAGLRLTIAVNNRLTEDTIPSGKMVDLSEQVGRKFFKFQPDFDFFHFAGIMGSVNMIQLPRYHFARIERLNAARHDRLTFNTCASDFHGDLLEAKIHVKILHESSLITLQEKTKPILSSSCETIQLPVMDYKIDWQARNDSFSQPTTLLRVSLSLETKLANSRMTPTIQDFVELTISTATSSIDKRLIQGFGMHHEQLFSGRTMSRAAIMKDINLLKQTGANVIRTSHYPYSTEYLDACDENGIMVIAECSAVGLNKFSDVKLMLHKQILLEMMERDHLHPSIIMWSIANEPQSQLEAAISYFESLTSYARNDLAKYTVDAKRPLTAAIAQSYRDDKIAHTLDVIMINNYYGWYDYTGVIEAIRRPMIASLSGWSTKHPDKRLMVSEFGADTMEGFHTTSCELFSEEFQRDLLVEYEHVFDEIYANKSENGINFIGSLIWNFADFSTHDSLLRVGGNRKGIFTRDRKPKLSVASVQEIYLRRARKFMVGERENHLDRD